MALKIKERDIEDFICENPKYFSMSRIIGRQIRLPHGILDVLGMAGNQLFVIELKAVPLKEEDVGQVLRYTFDVKEYLLCSGLYHYRERILDLGQSSHSFTDNEMRRQWKTAIGYQEPEDWEDHSVIPRLVGSSVDEKVFSAATAANIEIYRWEYFPRDNTFGFFAEFCDEQWDEDNAHWRNPPFPSWVNESIGHLANACRRRTTDIFDENCYELLGINDDLKPW